MGRRVTFTGDGAALEGYLAVPAEDAGPAVVVLGEWWAALGHIPSVCDRLAAEGFVALAPDLYRVPEVPDEAVRRAMVPAVDTAAHDVAAAARHLREEFGGRVGVLGFSLGGGLALRAAGVSEDLDAAVAFYPAGPWGRVDAEPGSYAGTPVLVHCADDESAAGTRDLAHKTIEAAGGELRVYDYPGTPEGFFDDDRPASYREDAAKAAWARTLELFRTRLS
ncbi:MAG TPA: dienelactone hydrolase family protein [Mycobacteriales bacterium]